MIDFIFILYLILDFWPILILPNSPSFSDHINKPENQNDDSSQWLQAA